MSSLKRIIMWDYSRGSWEYDVFCLLIIAFIFLTPPSWFSEAENDATRERERAVKVRDVSPTANYERSTLTELIIRPPGHEDHFGIVTGGSTGIGIH